MQSYHFHTCLTPGHKGNAYKDCLRYYINGKRVNRDKYDLRRSMLDRQDTFWSKTTTGKMQGGFTGYQDQSRGFKS